MMPVLMIYPAPSGTFASSTSSDADHRFAALMGRFRRSMGTLLGGVFICAAATAANRQSPRDTVPTEPSILEIQQGLTAGRFDVPALERHYEGRIRAIDQAGPRLNSVIESNPDAARVAADLHSSADRARPLFGVPILIKDNIDTADSMQTTAGS